MSLLRFPGRCLKSLFPWRLLLYPGNASMPPLASVQRLLVIRLDEIGDFVLASAFFRELRRSAPAARVTLVVSRGVWPLAKNCPYVDEVLAFDPRGSCGRGRDVMAARIRAWWMSLTHFRGRNKFQLILLPRRGADVYGAEFLAHLCAEGSAIAACRDQFSLSASLPVHVFNTAHYFNYPHAEQETLYSLRFLRWCGGETVSEKLETWPSAADKAFARDLLQEHFTRKRALIVLHPSGGKSPLKQWPVEKFQELLLALQRDFEIECLVVGGPDEPWIRDLFPSVPTRLLNLAGQLELNQLAAIFGEADLFVGCDSGPMHLAAASGVPVVAIFGSTSQVRFRPFSPKAEVVSLDLECSPDRVGTFVDRCKVCIYDQPRCLVDLPVELALARISSRLIELGHKGK